VKKITINVTAEDIENGVPKNICYCAIALAVKRALPAHDVSIDDDCVSLTDVESYYEDYPLPDSALVFIDQFDSGKKPQPFSFTLEMDE
jgi:hypothetical protein